ncbi:MAG: hypothetical protein AUI83_11660, partial [Armatimonadetes bacterium 13_1_40CM_3_65_7]
EDRKGPQIVHIATDGESYGHHHRFGDMALAHALRLIEERGAARLTNYGEFLALHPPDHEVEILEPTSWSCPHGVERWRGHCGCHAAHEGWTQEWRRPLREALDRLRDELVRGYEEQAARVLRDPWAAREAYIDIILHRSPEVLDAFFAAHGRSGPRAGQAQLMFTSCGWFFDELSGIETVQVIKHAARAIQLAQGFGYRLEDDFIGRLAAAKSNLRRWGDGARVYDRAVRPSVVTLSRVVAHYAISALFEPYAETARIFSYTVRRLDARREERSGNALSIGLVVAASRITGEEQRAAFAVLHLGGHDVQCGVRTDPPADWYERVKAGLAEAFLGTGPSDAVRMLDEHFKGSLHALPDLFLEARRAILGRMTAERLARVEAMYQTLYEESGPLVAFMRASDVPLPPAILRAAEYALGKQLAGIVGQAARVPLSDRAFEIARELEALEVKVDAAETELLLRLAAEARADSLAIDPLGPDLDQVHRLLDLAAALGVTVNLWQVQNAYHAASQIHVDRLVEGSGGDAGRVAEFWRLGERLNFNLNALRAPAVTPG